MQETSAMKPNAKIERPIMKLLELMLSLLVMKSDTPIATKTKGRMYEKIPKHK